MKKTIDAAKEYIEDLFAENSDGHGFDHSMRVYRNALLIADSYPDADNTVVPPTENTAILLRPSLRKTVAFDSKIYI